MLAHSLRRLASIMPAFFERLVFAAGYTSDMAHRPNTVCSRPEYLAKSVQTILASIQFREHKCDSRSFHTACTSVNISISN